MLNKEKSILWIWGKQQHKYETNEMIRLPAGIELLVLWFLIFFFLLLQIRKLQLE